MRASNASPSLQRPAVDGLSRAKCCRGSSCRGLRACSTSAAVCAWPTNIPSPLTPNAHTIPSPLQVAYPQPASQALAAAGLQYTLPGLTGDQPAAAAAAATCAQLVSGDLTAGLQAAGQGVAPQMPPAQVGGPTAGWVGHPAVLLPPKMIQSLLLWGPALAD